jgi:hypothetical protein
VWCVKGVELMESYVYRGSSFLKHWMDYLEENADLRYPDAGDLLLS